MGDGIPDLDLTARLDPRDNVADISRGDFLARLHIEAQYTDFIRIIFLTRGDELDVVTLAYLTVDDLEVSDDPTEGIKDGVKD